MHSVPVSDRHCVVVDGVKVDGHAVGRPNLILAAVSAANALGVVILGAEVFAEYVLDPAGGGKQFFVSAQGQCGYLNWGQISVYVGDNAYSVSVRFLIIGIQPEN